MVVQVPASRTMPPMPFTLSRFFRSLKVPTGVHTFNPWTDHDPDTDNHPDAPKHRLARLKAHLIPHARYLLVGEAPGYQGCKVTGIPFTSERLILESTIPRIGAPHSRLSTRPRPWSEPSATIVWGTLHELGIADEAILWNAYPWHPHKPGNRYSNRTPTTPERIAGLTALRALLNAYPDIRVFAVGRNAEAALNVIGQSSTPLRHPSMGGATAFRQQLRRHTR
jgi:uracil-DNA glycosylase